MDVTSPLFVGASWISDLIFYFLFFSEDTHFKTCRIMCCAAPNWMRTVATGGQEIDAHVTYTCSEPFSIMGKLARARARNKVRRDCHSLFVSGPVTYARKYCLVLIRDVFRSPARQHMGFVTLIDRLNPAPVVVKCAQSEWENNCF